ncbi:MAG: metal-dependent transcriptional regulator [Dehalococcoidia bacterium]|nr:metal-dependent transcriptional regulator [Dehalococcoidia bacterium]
MPSQVTNVASDDALTAIYRLQYDEEAEVIAARLAERLEITPPSMSAMLRRLERDGLVALDERKRVSLTPPGLERAQEMIRRHRLAECLLVDVLGLEWWRAYEEAHLLEHAISPITEALIDRRLGSPSHSPFGYPIPAACGAPPAPGSSATVADLTTGDHAEVDRVFEEDQELLRFLEEVGVRPCVPLRVEAHSPVRGTIELSVAGNSVVMGYPAARRIWVRRAE